MAVSGDILRILLFMPQAAELLSSLSF